MHYSGQRRLSLSSELTFSYFVRDTVKTEAEDLGAEPPTYQGLDRTLGSQRLLQVREGRELSGRDVTMLLNFWGTFTLSTF